MAEWWEQEGRGAASAAAPVEAPAEGAGGEWWDDSANRADYEPEDERDERPPPDPGMKQVAPGIWIRGDRSIGDYITGAAEVAGTVAAGALAEPVSGLVGLIGAAMPGEAGHGAGMAQATADMMAVAPESEVGMEMMEDVGSALQPVGEFFEDVNTFLGEGTLDLTGSPELATLAHTAPTAILEGMGLGFLRRPSKAAQAAIQAQERLKIRPDSSPDQIATQVNPPEAKSYEQITADLRAGRIEDVAEQVMPDEDIMAAAEALGVDLNPGHYSTSEAFVRVEQALKSRLSSGLAAREADAIAQLGTSADELIAKLGGETDRTLLETGIRNSVETKITDLETKADLAYGAVDDTIRQNAKAVKPHTRASQSYIDQRLADLGDDVSLLSTAETKLMNMLNREKPPTYGAVDALRREIADGYKRRGPFKDEANGTLDQVYKALITDQRATAYSFSDDLGATFDAGRKLVSSRKALEEQAVKLFGKQMNQDVLPKLAKATTKLTGGQTAQFKELFDALPAGMRQQAAATVLNDLFTMGMRSSGNSIGQGFAKAYQGLDTNLGAKAELFRHLPAEAQSTFDAIGKVSQGIYRAKSLENVSKTGRDILHALESAGLIQQMYGVARPVAQAVTFGAANLADAATNTARLGKKRVAKVDAVLNSPVFERVLNTAMEGRVKEAEMLLKASPVWRAFRGTLGDGTKEQLLAMGPIAWLTSGSAGELPQPAEPPLPQQPDPASPGMPAVGPPPDVFPGGQ